VKCIPFMLQKSEYMNKKLRTQMLDSYLLYSSRLFLPFLDLQARVAAIFAFVSFTSLLSIAGVQSHLEEIKVSWHTSLLKFWILIVHWFLIFHLHLNSSPADGIFFGFVEWTFSSLLSVVACCLVVNYLSLLQIYTSEESNGHSGAFVFLLGQLLSSIPFLFLISISSSLVFYFLVGLRDEFSLLMYFVLNFFVCLLVSEGLLLAVASVQLDVFWSNLTLVLVHVSFIVPNSFLRCV